jgi:hypothetical protein
MARYEHLPIYREAYDLTVHIVEKIVRNFSRYHKYTLGTDLQNKTRAVLEKIIEANNTPDRTVGHAGIGKAEGRFRVCLFHHCASVPPCRRKRFMEDVCPREQPAGMSIQVVVSPRGLRQPVVPATSGGCAGRSGRIYVSCAGVQSDNYWSSTTNADNTDNAWNVNLNNGNVNNDNKTNTNYVWPVRGGEWWSCRLFFSKKEVRYV